jgi:catechol 2,3-dioxygenase-like lactoylglutathione lyase family enzyme
MPKARLVGINHVALEVGSIDEALAFYGRLFDFRLRGRSATMAFIDMGDQFIALAAGRRQPKDEDRHFGLVVDDRASLRRALEEAGAEILPGRGLDFLDPWGNHIQVVEYRDIQFTKTPEVLDAMTLGHLDKSEAALKELADKGVRTEGVRSS